MDADNKKVIDLVGRSRICAIVSDSTGNTRLHRELLVDEIPTMFNLPDIVHFISNLIKDIVKIDYFKNTITIMRGVIAKFINLISGKQSLNSLMLNVGLNEVSLQSGGHGLAPSSLLPGLCNTIYPLSNGLLSAIISIWGSVIFLTYFNIPIINFS